MFAALAFVSQPPIILKLRLFNIKKNAYYILHEGFFTQLGHKTTLALRSKPRVKYII